MSTKSVVNRFGKTAKVMLVAIALLLIAGFIPSKSVHAWAYSGMANKPGAVHVPAIYVADIPIRVAGIWISQLTLLGSTGPTVFRSPGYTGEQIVSARYQVEKWNGARWVVVATSNVMTGRIAANQNSFKFAAPYIQPQPVMGNLRFTWIFVWLTRNNVMLGGTTVVPNVKGDHVCNTKRCQAYAGYFLLNKQ